jgi:hypothetical protein
MHKNKRTRTEAHTTNLMQTQAHNTGRHTHTCTSITCTGLGITNAPDSRCMINVHCLHMTALLQEKASMQEKNPHANSSCTNVLCFIQLSRLPLSQPAAHVPAKTSNMFGTSAGEDSATLSFKKSRTCSGMVLLTKSGNRFILSTANSEILGVLWAHTNP